MKKGFHIILLLCLALSTMAQSTADSLQAVLENERNDSLRFDALYSLSAYYLDEEKVYRLYVCEECRCYLKAIDLRQVGRPVLFPVERLTTLNMDLAARQEGYQ